MQMRQSSRKRPAKENQRTGAETSAELKMTFISFSPLIFPKPFFLEATHTLFLRGYFNYRRFMCWIVIGYRGAVKYLWCYYCKNKAGFYDPAGLLGNFMWKEGSTASNKQNTQRAQAKGQLHEGMWHCS